MATETSAVEPLVGVVMGSKSDWDTMKHAADLFGQ
jgi:phosphoribosylcarboxyaminoimidazole (NCAIR) mutase